MKQFWYHKRNCAVPKIDPSSRNSFPDLMILSFALWKFDLIHRNACFRSNWSWPFSEAIYVFRKKETDF